MGIKDATYIKFASCLKCNEAQPISLHMEDYFHLCCAITIRNLSSLHIALSLADTKENKITNFLNRGSFQNNCYICATLSQHFDFCHLQINVLSVASF